MSATATESTAFLTEFEDGFEEFEQVDGMDFEDDDDDEEEEEEEEDWGSEQVVTFPAHAPIQMSTETFASREPTLPAMERGQLSRTPSPEANGVEDERGKSPSTPPASTNSSDEDEDVLTMDHHKRFLRLQAFLKLCEESQEDKKALLHALRSLSAPARSGHAINLEYRALLLSIEEGKEMLRLKMLDVMGSNGKDNNASTPSQQTSSSSLDAGNTPEGSRLPAPGANTR